MYDNFDMMSGFTAEDIVEEGLFCHPEQSVADLLKIIRGSVAEKINTPEQAKELANKLSEEAVAFNDLLREMANAIRDFRAGNISKDDMLSVCGPATKELKENCQALKLTPTSVISDGSDCDITEEEIASLSELIAGAKSIVEERIQELEGYPGTDWNGKAGTLVHAAGEGLMDYLENEFEDAMEAEAGPFSQRTYKSSSSSSYSTYRHGPTAQMADTADTLLKQAKQVYKIGDKSKALGLLKKAQSMYEKCLEIVKKEKYSTTSTERGRFSKAGTEYTITETGYSKEIRKYMSYYEDRIDTCRALKLTWESGTDRKGTKSIYKETKDKLKAERKAAKAKAKAERKAAKAARKEEKKAAKAARKAAKAGAAAEAFFDDEYEQFAFEAELGIDFDDYDSVDEALEEMAIESEVEMMILERGFDEELL